jgi:hypothetical protein
MSKFDEWWEKEWRWSNEDVTNGVDWPVIGQEQARQLLAAFAADLLAKLEEKDENGNRRCTNCGEFPQDDGKLVWCVACGAGNYCPSDMWNTRHIDGEIRKIQEEWK